MTKGLPTTLADYIRTVNENDPAGFMALFAEDALVDDAGREIRNAPKRSEHGRPVTSSPPT